MQSNEWDVVHKGNFFIGNIYLDYTIIKEKYNKLGFDLYCVDVFGWLDRERVYGYVDDNERYLAFQIAVVEWMSSWYHRPDVIHVHDYHAGLIPFMLRHCYAYRHLSAIPVVLTIHNAQYQGWMNWEKASFIPIWDPWKRGLLEWNNQINPLASAIKCADKVNTVSHGYLRELTYNANGLEKLFDYEMGKCSGILNGIDYSVWDPERDTYILDNFSTDDFNHGKGLNKKKLCDDFGLDVQLPLVVFIGRLVSEKSADLLPSAITRAFEESEDKFNFIVLGNGDPEIENNLQKIHNTCFGYYHSQIQYNEKLSHQLYAGADFLLMPSRVGPCGLNQMYAMRYGTVPIVRRTGGLADTVIDYGDVNGYGLCFNNADVYDIVNAIKRAVYLYKDKETLSRLIFQMMKINNSWENSAQTYIDLYNPIFK
ncbi:MAG: glycosyltransferase [Ferruginibacter sp.]|nr:glycosyltransferase [Ferruginibacter sp.]